MCFFTRKLRHNNISLNKAFEDTFKRNSIQTLEMRMVFDGAFLDVTHGVMQGTEDAGVDPTSAKEVILPEDTAFSVVPLELPQDDEGGKEDPFSSFPCVAFSEDAGGEKKLSAADLARLEAEHYFGKEEYETFCFLFSNLRALYHSNLRGFDLFKDQGRENPNLNFNLPALPFSEPDFNLPALQFSEPDFNLPALPFSEGEDGEYYWMSCWMLTWHFKARLLGNINI